MLCSQIRGICGSKSSVCSGLKSAKFVVPKSSVCSGPLKKRVALPHGCTTLVSNFFINRAGSTPRGESAALIELLLTAQHGK